MLLLSACGSMILLNPKSAIPHPLQIITHTNIFYLLSFNYALFVLDYKGMNRLEKNPERTTVPLFNFRQIFGDGFVQERKIMNVDLNLIFSEVEVAVK